MPSNSNWPRFGTTPTPAQSPQCVLPDGTITSYRPLPGGHAFVEGGRDLPGGSGVGAAGMRPAMPTIDKPGGLAGGGKGGRFTSPASTIARDAFPGLRFGFLAPVARTASVGGQIARGMPVLGAAAAFDDYA